MFELDKVYGATLLNGNQIIGKVEAVDEENGVVYFNQAMIMHVVPSGNGQVTLRWTPPNFPMTEQKIETLPIVMHHFLFPPVPEEALNESILQAWYQEATGIIPATKMPPQDKGNKGELKLV